jgi:hypothetical protein
MSALIPLRLIYLRCGECRFVPIATERSAAKKAPLFDHLVGE